MIKLRINRYELISKTIRIFEEKVIKGEVFSKFLSLDKVHRKFIEKYKQEKLIKHYKIMLYDDGFRIEAHTVVKDLEISMIYFETMKNEMANLELETSIGINSGVFTFEYKEN